MASETIENIPDVELGGLTSSPLLTKCYIRSFKQYPKLV